MEYSLDKNALEYIKAKRKQYLFFIVVTAIFGLVLFLFSSMNKPEPFESYSGNKNKGITDLYGRIVSSVDGIPLKKSQNLLENPKFIPYHIAGNRIFLEKPFTFQNRKITDGIFQIKYHGNTIVSENFSSSDPGVFCKGTSKKGSGKFMVYYCGLK